MNPDKIMQVTYDNGWKKCKNTLLKVDRETVNNLKRFLLLHEPCENYSSKMDLVDHFPDIWKCCIQMADGTHTESPQFTLTRDEIELLRSVINGDKDMFMKRKSMCSPRSLAKLN